MKRFIAVFASVLMLAFVLAACGGDASTSPTPAPAAGNDNTPAPAGDTPAPAETGRTISFKVWAPQEEQQLMGTLVEKFKAANPENTYNIELGVVSEADGKTKYMEDPAAAADVFYFASDQLRDLVAAGALYPVTRNKADIVSRNAGGSISDATLNDELYAYPLTSDNGYFLYYDKSVLSEDDVKSLDTILEKSAAAGKKFFMDVSNGWYIASFFLGNGGTLTTEDGEHQICDFNNAAGVAAGEAIKALTADAAFLTGDDDVLKGGIGGSVSAGVSGTWNADAIGSTLGDNYAATKLPTFTCDGKQVQMSSFSGSKLVGVNSLTPTEYATDVMDFADFITNEASQLERFNARKLGPTNVKAASDPAVQADIALAGFLAQNVFSKTQKDVLGNYWSPAEAFGTAMENKDYGKDTQTYLNEMVAQITA